MADRPQLDGKKAVILTADEFEDMELFFPLFRLIEEGAEVTIAAPTKGPIHGENGYSLEVETTIDEINPANFDLLIIPGGSPGGAPTTVRNVASAREIAKAFFAGNKPVASICRGPYTRVSAGLVSGRRLTSY